ncbi:protein of unknown function [Chryseobacterium indologenes]|nr:protein of unknown function [Chryseobacterium indologenes]SUX53415.1 Uncharacterised protein [Chryseobacterium indologenes]VFA44481.1 Uncharacterised protein [Chryseobacterium indologenes]
MANCLSGYFALLPVVNLVFLPLNHYVCHMFSKQEAQQLKKEFWTAFGKSFPRKWILYDTKVKDMAFKFSADNKKAEVSLDIEMKDEIFRNAYYDKIWSLEDMLKEEIGEFYKEEYYTLENGKVISRIWVEKSGVSIFNKNTWQEIFEFFVDKMNGFERFYYEYEDFIKDI